MAHEESVTHEARRQSSKHGRSRLHLRDHRGTRCQAIDNRQSAIDNRRIDTPHIDRPGAFAALVLSFAQDAVYALIFLSYMNHYLLDVLKTSAGVPGFTLALYGGVKLAVHPAAGRLIDRTSPRLVFRGALAAQVGGGVLLLLVHSLAAFLIATCLLAAGSAAMWPLIYDTVAHTQAPAVRSEVTGLLSLAGYIGTGAGFAAGVLLAHFAPWRAAFVLTIALVGLPALLQAMRAFDRGVRVPESKSTAGAASRLAGVALFAVVVFIDYAAVSALAAVYGPYVRISLNISLLRTSLLLIPAAVAALAALYLASRWSRPSRRMMEMALLFAVSAAGALALAATREPLLAAAFAPVLAVGAGGVGPIIAASMIDHGGRADRGFVIGTLMSIEGIGAVIGPGAVAIVIDAINPQAGLALIGATFAVLVPLALVSQRRSAASAARSPA